jgi:hypothetical protein
MIYTEQDRLRRLEEMRQLAVNRGGACLSDHYVDNKTKLRWRCAEGHEWSAIPSNIQRGIWCRICGNRRAGRLKAHTIEMMQEIAAKRSGKCLSITYKNNITKLRWRCKNGHEWQAVPGSIVGARYRKGSWCPICAGKLPKNLALEALKIVAAEHGGKLLSDRYINARTRLRWECAKGHQWEAVPDAVKRGGWCPVCAGSFPLNIELMRKAAEAFGGHCITQEYVNVDTKLRWRCADGHEWDAKPYHVLAGHWCPLCASGISERICRALLERMTGYPFPKTRPEWLENERGRQMELDGYAEPLGLAFEYQGHQHYRPVPYLGSDQKTFEQRQQDDGRKRDLCRQHRVTLLEIPYYISHDKLQGYLVKTLNELKRELVVDDSPVKIEDLGVWRRRNLEQMQSIAAARGGKLLSTSYINATTKLLWQCSKGHTWNAIPNSIRQGTWCPECGTRQAAAKRAHTIEEMQALAKAKGGLCLSSTYKNARNRLLWRCAKAHEWEAQASPVIGGHWCPVCAGNQRLTIDDMKQTANEQAGKCLSAHYINGRSKLRWRCSKGHIWEAAGDCVRQGNWCPICAGKHPKPLPG